jgi:hypothetical protein
MGEVGNTYSILVGKPEGGDNLGAKRIWEDNFKMDLVKLDVRM